MIINIPLQIDEHKMEEVLQRDYEGKILSEIMNQVKKTLYDNASRYYGDRVSDGMCVLIEKQIKSFLNEHKDEVIDNASKILAEKLARSKKGKEILGGLDDDRRS